MDANLTTGGSESIDLTPTGGIGVVINPKKHHYRCAKGHEWESGWGKPNITFTQEGCESIVLEGCMLCLADVLRPFMVPVEEVKDDGG